MFIKTNRAMVAILLLQALLQGTVYAAAPVVLTAQGTASAISSLSASLKKVSDNTASTLITFPAGNGMATGDSYVDLSFNDNTVGSQAVMIYSDNRNASASPKYSGIAQGSGLVGQTVTDQVVPLKWVVFDGLTAYTFTNGNGEFFMQDKLQGTTSASQNPTTGASACNDKNKNGTCETGEYTDRNANAAFNAVLWSTGLDPNRCDDVPAPGPLEGVDWDGDCYDGAKPMDTGFGSVLFGISFQSASLSDAGGGASPTAGRSTSDGNVKVYAGTNYTGAEAQGYKTNRLTVELATVA